MVYDWHESKVTAATSNYCTDNYNKNHNNDYYHYCSHYYYADLYNKSID